MSNHDGNHDDHDESECVRDAIDRHEREHDREHAESARIHADINAYLDALTPKQAIVMRHILAMNNNEYIDGVLTTLLRRVHNVDPQTGKSIFDDLAANEKDTPSPTA